MVKFPGIRPTAEVVAILNKTPRRAQVVGILNAEGSGDVLRLTPCDPRMPHMMVNASSMPSGIQQRLLVCPFLFFSPCTYVCDVFCPILTSECADICFSLFQSMHLFDLAHCVQQYVIHHKRPLVCPLPFLSRCRFFTCCSLPSSTQLIDAGIALLMVI